MRHYHLFLWSGLCGSSWRQWFALRRALLFLGAGPTLLALVLGGAVAQAQTAEEFEKLRQLCWKWINAGYYHDAHELAMELYAWAKGPLADQPARLAEACDTLAAIYQNSEIPITEVEGLGAGANVHRYSNADARRLYKEALQVYRKLYGPEHPSVAQVLNNLGNSYYYKRNFALAETYYREALRIYRQSLGAGHPHVAESLANLANLYGHARRYAEAEPLYREAAEIYRKVTPGGNPQLAQTLNNLANMIALSPERSVEAEALYKESVTLYRNALGEGHPDVGAALGNLAWFYLRLGRTGEALTTYREAVQVYRNALGWDPFVGRLLLTWTPQQRLAAIAVLGDALELIRLNLGADHPEVADVADALGTLCYASRWDLRGTRYSGKDSEQFFREALRIRRNTYGDQHPLVAGTAVNLARALPNLGAAESLYKEALGIYRAAQGPHGVGVAICLEGLNNLYLRQGRQAEADAMVTEILQIWRARGRNDPVIAEVLMSLVEGYCFHGRVREAEALFRELFELLRRKGEIVSPEDMELASVVAAAYLAQGRSAEAEYLLNQLIGYPPIAGEVFEASLWCVQDDLRAGFYAEAEGSLRNVVGTLRHVFGREHLWVGGALRCLAGVCLRQGRYAEAERLLMEALSIFQKGRGRLPEAAGAGLAPLGASPELVRDAETQSLATLALVYMAGERYGDAEPLFRASLDREPDRDALTGLGLLCWRQGRYEEAEKYLLEATKLPSFGLGVERLEAVNHLAAFYAEQGRRAEAERYLWRAEQEVADAGGEMDPQHVAGIRQTRAMLLWDEGRKAEAIGVLGEALESIEKQRHRVYGGEWERGAFFARWAPAFELMVDWQEQLRQANEVFRTMERYRARGLVEQMERVAIDLLAGLSQEEAQPLRERWARAARQVTRLRRELLGMGERRPEAPRDPKDLQAALQEAQAELAQAYAEVCNATRAYRLAVSEKRRPVALNEFQGWAQERKALVLEYFVGEKGGYVLAVPSDGKAEVLRLEVTAAQAAALGVEPGPLSAKGLRAILSNEKGTGLLQRLRRSKSKEPTRAVVPALARLWEVLIPAKERKALLEGSYASLIVLPDGALSQLPFEALVVSEDHEPRFLMEIGPPVLYAPSATVLVNLQKRSAVGVIEQREPVLLVGACSYGSPRQPEPTEELLLAARSWYGRLGGRLGELPHTATELEWLNAVFQGGEQKVAWLRREWATERNVRGNVAGRRVVHFATHGLADQAWGNLFGGLALTPGPEADDPNDDGFLTLGEIYGLDLKGCELVVLSACDTNVGPEQRGEGIHGLARGFLVAGARRVVATQWEVADEATAHLMTIFATYCMEDQKAGRAPDYAAALQKAKRWMRTQREHPEWHEPYYWAPFVLIGAR